MGFTDIQVERYSRHFILPEVGGKGQKKIAQAKVMMIGAGGLGSPAALYLAASGVGTLGIIDHDVVDLSNLQRQILHSTHTINHPKVQSAFERLRSINPDVTVVPYQQSIDTSNIAEIFDPYDIIVDGSDNFATRYLINDASFFAKKTLVSASMFRFEGQLTTLKPHQASPCYRCLYPEPPPEGLVPNCQEAGVLGALAGTMGSLQASEVIKEILEIGTSLAGRLMLYDALSMTFREVKIPKDQKCALCGPSPTITKFLDYSFSCTLPQ
tara:strand:+ start:3253 stop:4059 length:807 start_codon:yes stop_codon:yes gene_type:complete